MRSAWVLAVLLVAALPFAIGACGGEDSPADDEAKIRQAAQKYADATKGYNGKVKSVRIEGSVARANIEDGGFVLLRKQGDRWIVGAPEAESEALGAPPAPAPDNLRPCTPAEEAKIRRQNERAGIEVLDDRLFCESHTTVDK